MAKQSKRKIKEIIKLSKTEIIKRSEIRFAPYNPRKIDKKVVEEIRKNIKRVGYLGGIVWNKLSGNLVGGHKRIEAMDIIFNYDGKNNYDVKVEVVEFDDKTEKEQNIFLNNKRVQGETDYELLSIILPDITIENTGLLDYDLNIINSLIPNNSFGKNNDIIQDANELKNTAKKTKEEVKQIKADIKEQNKENQRASHFTIVFKTYDEKAEYLESIGINGDTSMITASEYLSKLREE